MTWYVMEKEMAPTGQTFRPGVLQVPRWLRGKSALAQDRKASSLIPGHNDLVAGKRLTVGSAPVIVVVAIAAGLALIVVDLPRASRRRHHHVTS